MDSDGKKEYQERFEENPSEYDRGWQIYGELIWHDLNILYGEVLDPSYNILLHDVIKHHFHPGSPKILHCHGDSVKDVLAIVEWVTTAYQDFKNRLASQEDLPDQHKSQ